MQKPFKAADLVHMMKGLVPQVVTLATGPVTPSTEPNTPSLVERGGENYFT